MTTTITIGYQRQSDGDVAVLTTLNNIDELLDEATLEEMVLTLVMTFTESLDEDVRAWERQDTPDYLSGEDLENWVDVTPEF